MTRATACYCLMQIVLDKGYTDVLHICMKAVSRGRHCLVRYCLLLPGAAWCCTYACEM